MRFGIAFPTNESWASGSPEALRDYAAAAEDAGLHYLTAADHVLGADSSTRPDWTGPYDATCLFREVFVFFGYLAASTNLELMTAILILSQRQTAVVAKQAAEVDFLSHGRTRLGVGVGWNSVEFQGLGVDFHTRGAYYEEQLEVLRLFWTEPVVTYEGKFHHIDRAGILPLPMQRPIPIWMGGGAEGGPLASSTTSRQNERVIDRIGRLGDGWIAGHRSQPEAIAATFSKIRAAAERAGRDPGAVGLQASLHVEPQSDRGFIANGIAERRAIGVTHLTMETRVKGRELSLQENLDLIGMIGEALKAEG